MPLLNHFAWPLDPLRPWSGSLVRWANAISDHFNKTLPDGWFAHPEIRWRQEGDSVVVDERENPALSIAGGDPLSEDGGGGGVATAALAEPKRTLDFDPDHDVVEVRVLDERGRELVLAGVVEIVSPANKDRPSTREAFVAKTEGYIGAGVGTVIADIVTDKTRSLHRQLCQRMGDPDPEADPVYASAYRLMDESPRTVQVWHEALAVDAPLPEMPLYLKGGPAVAVPLEATYVAACEANRIDGDLVRRRIAERARGEHDALASE